MFLASQQGGHEGSSSFLLFAPPPPPTTGILFKDMLFLDTEVLFNCQPLLDRCTSVNLSNPHLKPSKPDSQKGPQSLSHISKTTTGLLLLRMVLLV